MSDDTTGVVNKPEDDETENTTPTPADAAPQAEAQPSAEEATDVATVAGDTDEDDDPAKDAHELAGTTPPEARTGVDTPASLATMVDEGAPVAPAEPLPDAPPPETAPVTSDASSVEASEDTAPAEAPVATETEAVETAEDSVPTDMPMATEATDSGEAATDSEPMANDDTGTGEPSESVVPLDAATATEEAASTTEATATDTATVSEGDSGRPKRSKGKKPRQGRKLDSFTAGEELEGTVRSLQAYGAFVDVGAERDGLVHISELRDGFVEKVEDVVKEGDTVKVRVKEVDVEKGRLSLTMRQPRPAGEARETRPSEGRPASAEGRSGEQRGSSAEGRPARRQEKEEGDSKRTRLRDIEEGQELTGRVTSIVDYGAFVDIGAVTDGLVHISEISTERISSVNAVLTEGQEVAVRVLSVDRKRNRVSLSMKPAEESTSIPEDYSYETEEEDEVPPSMMQFAFAKAREQENTRRDRNKKSKRARDEKMDDIINRTLGLRD